jgi:hypothetical protein
MMGGPHYFGPTTRLHIKAGVHSTAKSLNLEPGSKEKKRRG